MYIYIYVNFNAKNYEFEDIVALLYKYRSIAIKYYKLIDLPNIYILYIRIHIIINHDYFRYVFTLTIFSEHFFNNKFKL